jgi:hypothetical protein
MIQVHFQILPESVLQFLLRIGAAVDDLTRPITEILEDALRDAFTEVTASKGGLYGQPWLPMKFFTQWFHRREPSTLLEASGALAASLVRGGSGNIFEVAPLAGTTGTRAKSAIYHQHGTSRTFRILQFLRFGVRGFNVPGMVARPFLDWHVENFERYAQMVALHLIEAVNEA